MTTHAKTMLFALTLSIGVSGRPAAAAPITDVSYFSAIPHTVINFDVHGSGAPFSPVLPAQGLPANEYAAQGVTFLPNTNLAQDSDSCFRLVQYVVSGGSSPYGLTASTTTSMNFNPPVKAFGFVFIAISAQFATFTARDANGAVIETAVFADCTPRVNCFVHGTGCGFLEYGFVGISSACTPIASVDISAFSGVIDNLNFAAADGNGGTLPTITCPANAIVECGGSTDVASTGTATSTGGCGTVTLTHSDATSSGACVNQVLQTITRTWTATDTAGKFATCAQTITVKDTMAPVITASGTTLTLGCNPTALMINAALGTATAIDTCGSVTAIPSDSAVTGGCTKSQTRTWTSTDACGNAAAPVSRTVTWTEDTTPPVITASGIPANGVLGCSPTPAAIEAALGTATASDNCVLGTLTSSDSAVTGTCTKSQTRTWNVTDACGNAAITVSRTATWTVDSTPPVITASGTTLTLGCNPTAADIDAALGSATASDNCGVGTPTAADSAVTGGCTKTQTRTWNVSDNCGNAAVAVSRTVTWTDDTTPPTITTCPTGGYLGSNPTSLPTCETVTAQVVASDDCTDPLTINCPNPVDSNTNCVVTRTFTITATDACGNVSDPCYVTYTWIADTDAPIIACASAPINLGCNPGAASLPTADDAAAQVTATDGNCGLPTIHCDANPDSGTCMVTRTFSCTATDISGNVSSDPCTVTYTWTVDSDPPVIAATGTTLTLGCNPTAEQIEAALGAATAADNCSVGDPIVITDSVVVSDCGRSQTRRWNVSDGCGNSAAEVSRTVTWTVDTEAPVITATGSTLTLGCNPSGADIEAALGTASATDNCGATAPTATTSTAIVNGCSVSQTRTWNVTDACGNAAIAVTRTATWTVDTTPPVITASGTTMTLGCNPTAAAIEAALGTATATDDCGNVTPTASDSSVVENGCGRSQTRTWNATDACGNVATAVSRTVTWTEDTTPPVITATGSTFALGCNPTDADIEAALGTASATDNCGAVTPTASDDSVVVNGCSRSQTRTWNVTDACGNAAVAVSRTVTWTKDTSKPTITTCPPGGNLGSNPETLPTCDSLRGMVVATDDCMGTPTIDCTSDDSTTNCVVARNFTITATDACGNVSDPCHVTYTWIADTSVPVIACASNVIDLGCNPSAGTLPTADDAAAQVTATDSSCGVPTVHCDANPDSGTCVITRTFTCTATDIGNNVSAPCDVTYTWKVDTTRPVITASGTTLTLGCHPSAAAIQAALGSATATDNCGSVAAPTFSDSSVTGGCTKSQTRTWHVTDACGNTALPVSRTVTWSMDTSKPIIVATGTTLNLGCNPTAAAIDAALGTATATETCGAVTPTYSDSSVVVGGCSRCQTRTWSAIDPCGNVATRVSRTVSWKVDTTPPVITCPTDSNSSCGGGGHGDDDGNHDGDDDDGDDDGGYHDGDNHGNDVGIVRYTEPGKCSAVVWYPAPTVSDHCSSTTVTCSPPSGTSFPKGTTMVTCTAIDACGNMASCTFPVIVKDRERPDMACPTDIVRSTDPGQCSAVVNFTAPAATDNCPGVTVVCNPPSGSTFAKGRTTVACTATDTSGNTISRAFTITVRDTERPVMNCTGDITLPCSASRLAPTVYSVTATDNCPGVDLRYSKDCGSGFPVGSTPVTATATDTSGNSSTCSFNVNRAAIGFVGFQSPIGGADATGGSSASPLATFKLGSTIPVKFTASCGGSPLLTGVHTIQAVKFSSTVGSNPPIDATPPGGATSGNQFRLAGSEWYFNLGTQAGFSTGTWKLTATLSDGSQHYVWITLKTH